MPKPWSGNALHQPVDRVIVVSVSMKKQETWRLLHRGRRGAGLREPEKRARIPLHTVIVDTP